MFGSFFYFIHQFYFKKVIINQWKLSIGVNAGICCPAWTLFPWVLQRFIFAQEFDVKRSSLHFLYLGLFTRDLYLDFSQVLSLFFRKILQI